VVGLAELKASVTSSDHPAGVALLLGAEGPGLTDSALAMADVVIRIPMAEGFDSLNVATAAGLSFHALADL
jgi:tRNA G18 (ribose-2'-O)-methylase SpoU